MFKCWNPRARIHTGARAGWPSTATAVSWVPSRCCRTRLETRENAARALVLACRSRGEGERAFWSRYQRTLSRTHTTMLDARRPYVNTTTCLSYANMKTCSAHTRPQLHGADKNVRGVVCTKKAAQEATERRPRCIHVMACHVLVLCNFAASS